MNLGIDASNISSGGGLNHLVNLISVSNPEKHGFSVVVLWASNSTLRQIPDRVWLKKCTYPALQRGLIARSLWKTFRLPRLVAQENCKLLFVPGGSQLTSTVPVVTMSRNLLPFQLGELARYGVSFKALKLLILRYVQAYTFKKAAGVIFLTSYAKSEVLSRIGNIPGTMTIIPHGLDRAFMQEPREQRHISEYNWLEIPVRLIYVSIIDVYKHQSNVALAIKELRDRGFPVELELVGPHSEPAYSQLKCVLDDIDSTGSFCHCLGAVANEKLPQLYREADICIFASSCENMPNILLEGMASGLPIACSNKGPMPDMLKDAGVYFNPEDVQEIADSLQSLLESAPLRSTLSRKSYSLAGEYSWQSCADGTFKFLRDVSQQNAL